MRVVRFEIKRAFGCREFKIALLIGTVIAAVDIVSFYRMFSGVSKVVSQAWLGTDFYLPYSSLYVLLIPLLAALPYGGSYYRDVKSGYIKNILVKCSRGQYFFAKSIAVFLSAASAVMIPMTVDLIVCMGIYPMREPEKQLADAVFVSYSSIFYGAYAVSSVLYILCCIALDGILSGLLSILCICVSDNVNKYFSVVTFPFLAVSLLAMLLADNNENCWSVLMMLDPLQFEPRTANVCAFIAAVLCIVIMILNRKSERKEIL